MLRRSIEEFRASILRASLSVGKSNQVRALSVQRSRYHSWSLCTARIASRRLRSHTVDKIAIVRIEFFKSLNDFVNFLVRKRSNRPRTVRHRDLLSSLRGNDCRTVGVVKQVRSTGIGNAPFEHCQKQPAPGCDERTDVRCKPLPRFFGHIGGCLERVFARVHAQLCVVGFIRVELDKQSVRPAVGENLEPIVQRWIGFVCGALFDDMLEEAMLVGVDLHQPAQGR